MRFLLFVFREQTTPVIIGWTGQTSISQGAFSEFRLTIEAWTFETKRWDLTLLLWTQLNFVTVIYTI